MIGFEIVRAGRHASRGLFHALAELGSARMVPPRDAREAVHRLAGALGTIARAHAITVRVSGEIPRSRALIVANHISYLDPLAILPVCPAAPFAKADVAGWPLVGPIGAALGVVYVDRDCGYGRTRALRRMYALLGAGVPVLNFPEGTTTRGGEVKPFYRAGFGVAQRLGIPVVPVAIRYRDPALAWCDGATFLPHYARVAARERIEVELAFLPPLPTRAGELPEDYAARARNAIARSLGKA